MLAPFKAFPSRRKSQRLRVVVRVRVRVSCKRLLMKVSGVERGRVNRPSP